MPTIDFIGGVRIAIYFNEHRPPHIHAFYNEFEAVILIRDATLITGYLPEKQMRKVTEWLFDNKDRILSIFYRFNPSLR